MVGGEGVYYNLKQDREDRLHCKVTFQPRPEGNQEISHMAIWQKNFPGRENCQRGWRNVRGVDAGVAVGNEVREVGYER